jgi:hypothetical protein
VNQSQRHGRYQELREQLGNLTDALGMPIDADILDLVVVLNALGFPTSGSCAGHLEAGATPYVDLDLSVSQIDLQEAVHALRQADLQEAVQQLSAAEIQQLRAHANHLYQRLNAPALQMRQRLTIVLNRFYQNHHARYEEQMSLKSLLSFGAIGHIRLENQGAEHFSLLGLKCARLSLGAK